MMESAGIVDKKLLWQPKLKTKNCHNQVHKDKDYLQSFNLKSLLTVAPTVALIANKKFSKFPPKPDFPFPDKFVNKCFKRC